MEPRNIDEQIREYYGAQKPPAESVIRLKEMIANRAQPRSFARRWMSVAAIVAVVVSASVWVALRHSALRSPHQMSAEIAQQAATGHNENQELEFRVRHCAELRAKMKSLDFTPVEPSMMQHMNMQIIGARYATLGGEMAAQIVYIDPKGIPCTLYEARPADRLARITAGEHQIDGLHVSVWSEKGLVMVLARPMA